MATDEGTSWERVKSHFEHMSEYVTGLLTECDSNPYKEKMLAFAERPAASVSMIDVSGMETEGVHAYAVLSTYMNPFKRALIVAPSAGEAEDMLYEYAGNHYPEPRDKLLKRLFLDLNPRFGSPCALVMNRVTHYPIYPDLSILYPTHLKTFITKQGEAKQNIEVVVIIDALCPRRWSTITPTVLEHFGNAKTLLLTEKPDSYEFTRL